MLIVVNPPILFVRGCLYVELGESMPTAASPDLNDYRLDDQIGPLLRRAYQRACSNLSARLDGHRVTPIQYSTLVRLWEYGAVSQNRLGRLLEIKSGNMHGVVRRLQERELVATAQDPDHRGRVLLKLSRTGLQLVKSSIPLSRQATADTLAPLSSSEQKQLFHLMRLLIDD